MCDDSQKDGVPSGPEENDLTIGSYVKDQENRAKKSSKVDKLKSSLTNQAGFSGFVNEDGNDFEEEEPEFTGDQVGQALAGFSKTLEGFTKLMGSINQRQNRLEQLLESQMGQACGGAGNGATTQGRPLNGGGGAPNLLHSGLGEFAAQRQAGEVRHDDRLSDSVRLKIQGDDYVDFHDLLEKDDTSYALKINFNGGANMLSAEPRAKKELNISEWRKAFGIFQACYLCKFSPPDFSHQDLMNASQDLIRYEALISRMAEDNLDWRYYDLNFRKNRRRTKVRFSYKDADLYTDATCRSLKILEQSCLRSGGYSGAPANYNNNFGRKFRQDQPSIYVKDGYCFAYHKAHTSCIDPECLYNHSCFLCGRRHPAHSCFHSRRLGQERPDGRPPAYPSRDRKDGRRGEKRRSGHADPNKSGHASGLFRDLQR